MNATTTRQATGTYYPSVPGARTLADAKPLYIDGHRVSAVVDADGTWTVFIGGSKVATSQLTGAEGELNSFFAAAAQAAAEAAEEGTGYRVSTEDKPETEEEVMVWIPVGSEEIELATGAAWDIHFRFEHYRNLSRTGQTFAAMNILKKLKEQGYGLAHHELRDVSNWVADGGLNK